MTEVIIPSQSLTTKMTKSNISTLMELVEETECMIVLNLDMVSFMEMEMSGMLLFPYHLLMIYQERTKEQNCTHWTMLSPILPIS